MSGELAKPRTLRRLSKSLAQLISRVQNDVCGVAAVEFSIVAPLMILMVLCTIDLGLGTFRMLQVENAAHAGSQYAILRGFNASAITTAITSATSFSDITASPAPYTFSGCATTSGVTTVSADALCADGSTPGTYVTASSSGTYSTLFSYPGIPNSFQFKGQSTVRIQ
jgi:Flp pilus assembly protein TadG